MKQKSVLRAALAIGGLAGIVTLSACAPSNTGSAPVGQLATSPQATAPAAPSQAANQAPNQQAATPGKPVPATADKSVRSAPAHIYFPVCAGPKNIKSGIEPSSIMISCDSTFELRGAHWTAWNGSYAQGTGQLAINDCTPDCATGKSHVTNAKIRFDKPMKLSCGEFWTEAVFTDSTGKVEHFSPVTNTGTAQSEICGS